MHPKLTPERLARLRVVVFPLPDTKLHAVQHLWLRRFPLENVFIVPKIQTMITCTRNIYLMECAKQADRYDEFMFIDGDVIPDNRTNAFWESDADVVCCKAEMPSNHTAWSSPLAWHDPLWRCKSKVLQQVPVPYYEYALNNIGTREIHCICMGFAEKCRRAGFSVGVSGECGHQNIGSWQSTGCKHLDFGE